MFAVIGRFEGTECAAQFSRRSMARVGASGVASSISGGGGGDIFIYSCSALLIYFEIDCFYGL